MRADECTFHRMLIDRFIDRADVSSNVNAPVSFENTAKRMVAQRRVKGIISKNRNALLKTPFYFYRQFLVLFREAAVKKDFHRRLR